MPRRSPVASGIASHGEPSVRAHAVGPSAGSASSHSRSAVCSRRSRRPACSSPRVLLQRQDRDGRELVAAQLRRDVLERHAADERDALAERDLVGVDHEPLDGRDDDGQRDAAVRGVLELREGGGEALVVVGEVGRVGPHRGDERLQRGVGQRACVGALRAAAAGAEVAGEVRQSHHPLDGRDVRGQPRERAGALGEEPLGQRAVAVQRAGAASLLDQLEGDLRAARDLVGQLPGRLLHEGGEGVVQRSVVHAPRVRRSAGGSCRTNACLQSGGAARRRRRPTRRPGRRSPRRRATRSRRSASTR